MRVRIDRALNISIRLLTENLNASGEFQCGKGFESLLDFLVGTKTKNLNQDLNLGGRTILKF